jgi:DeoR/GlpR family transcriptional regulator of sugar metabolism
MLGRAHAFVRRSGEQRARCFDAKAQTRRRSLNALCQRGLLACLHGGTRPANSVTNVEDDNRRHLLSETKRRIGNRCSLFPDLGITTERIALGIAEYAHKTALVADQQKLERTVPVRGGAIGRIGVFVPDREPPTRFRKACRYDRGNPRRGIRRTRMLRPGLAPAVSGA